LDVLVAISDSGIIKRGKGVDLPEVCKADQIEDAVRTLIKQYQKANGFFSLDFERGGYEFTDTDIPRVTEFLLQQHQPLAPSAQTISESVTKPLPRKPAPVTATVAQTPPIKPAVPSTTKLGCRQCQSYNVQVEYGKYGYYFKCQACEGNTPIKTICPKCKEVQRLRKSGKQFYAECATCTTSELFYTNT